MLNEEHENFNPYLFVSNEDIVKKFLNFLPTPSDCLSVIILDLSVLKAV